MATPNPVPTPPPIPTVPSNAVRANGGFAFVLLTCLFPAAVALVLAMVSPNWWDRQGFEFLPVAGSLALPVWAAVRLHRRRKAAGIHIFPYGWLAAGAGLVGAIVLSLIAIAASVCVVFLVILASCCVNGK